MSSETVGVWRATLGGATPTPTLFKEPQRHEGIKEEAIAQEFRI